MQHRAVSACPLKYSLRICEFCLSPVADADRRDAAKALRGNLMHSDSSEIGRIGVFAGLELVRLNRKNTRCTEHGSETT